MLKYETFLEAKNTISYIDHNDEKQVVDLSGYKRDRDGNHVTYYNNELHSYDDKPAAISHTSFSVFHWFRVGKHHRDNNLPSRIGERFNFQRSKMDWRIDGGLHRTNGPALIRFNNRVSFHIEQSRLLEEYYVPKYKENILKRLKEHPLDIQFYKIPNFEFQKLVLDINPSIVKYIQELHPDLKKTKHGSSHSAGLFD